MGELTDLTLLWATRNESAELPAPRRPMHRTCYLSNLFQFRNYSQNFSTFWQQLLPSRTVLRSTKNCVHFCT